MPKHVLLGSRPFVIQEPSRPPGFDPSGDGREKQENITHTPEKTPSEPPRASQDARPVVERVTVIVVNFKTPKLVRTAITSLLRFYEVDVLAVDNGSGDGSAGILKQLAAERKHVTAVLNGENLGHGPAMHRAAKSVTTPFFFTLDSDCEVLRAGFFEAMLAEMDAHPQLYALGWRRWVDRRSGVPLEWHLDHPPKRRFVAYVHPAAALFRAEFYHQLHPFAHHGAPCLRNMIAAEQAGYGVRSFRVFDYINHLEAGTRRMYGGRWDPKPTEAPKPWKKNERYPI
jgi:hypothetical protein